VGGLNQFARVGAGIPMRVPVVGKLAVQNAFSAKFSAGGRLDFPAIPCGN
jgi:hypothetical protein